jgi:hypothetical protein
MTIFKFGISAFIVYLQSFFSTIVLADDLGPGAAGPIQLQQLVQRFINLIVPVAFVILTVMLIIGGIKFLTSGGDPKALGSASQTVTWAFLGILFLVLAWLILLLIQNFTGVNVTQFCLGIPGGSNQNNCVFQ